MAGTFPAIALMLNVTQMPGIVAQFRANWRAQGGVDFEAGVSSDAHRGVAQPG